MATTDNVEFTLIAADLTTKLAILPVISSHIYLEINEPGSGELKIPLDTTSASLVTEGMYVDCSYRGVSRSGFFVDNIAENEANSQEYSGRVMSISGRGALALLEDAIVWDDGTTASTRTFTGKTKADILITLITEAQARGGLASLTYDFTATDDSESVAWTDSDNYTLTVGSSYLDVARQFSATGTEFAIVYSAGGFVLSAYQGEIGTDKSATIFFRTGGNCEEVSKDRRAGVELKNVMRVAFQGGNTTAEDATSITNYRRREKSIDARLAQSLSSASTYATAKLNLNKDPRKSVSVRVYDGVKPNLFLDYILGDYVTLDVIGTETRYRVLGLQCDFDGVAYGNIVVEMNTIIRDVGLELEERLAWLTQQWQTAHDDNKLETSVWGKLTLNCDYQIFAMLLDGDNLYLGGEFTTIGMLTESPGIAMVNIKTGVWTDLGGLYSGAGNGYCTAIAKDPVTGNIIFGGDFDRVGLVAANSVAKLTVATGVFSALGTGLTIPATPTTGVCYSLGFTSTGVLWVGGYYTHAGGVASSAMAYYDGSWHAGGLTTDTNVSVYAIAIDSSNNVYAGGDFYKPDSAGDYIAMWNGSAWEELDTGLDNTVNAIAIGASDYAYIAGYFTDAGGVAKADGATVWNGTIFQALGDGIDSSTYDVYTVHVDTYGSVFYGGNFTTLVNGLTVNGLARWTGSTWLAVGVGTAIGTDGDVRAIETSSTGDLYIGGYFWRAGDIETEAAGNGLHNAVYLTTFQAVMDYVNSGAGSYHNPATLDPNANAILSITDGQVLGLDTQTANRVFAGPTSGGAAVPAFRALVAADIPAGVGGDISGTGVVGQLAEFVTNTKTIQAARIISNVTAGKTLTLTATDNYALTVPATGTAALLQVANVYTVGGQMVDSTADAIELRLQAHSTKTTSFLTIEKSDGMVWAGFDSLGRVFSYGKAAVTTNFLANGSGNATMTGTGNVLLGSLCGTGLTSGFNNFCLGSNTGAALTTGDSNILIGTTAGALLSGEIRNVFIGVDSGKIAQGSVNVFIGHGAGVKSSSANENVFLGANSGDSNTTGDNNIFLGSRSGYYQVGTNRLIIDSILRASAAVELTNGIIVGVIATTPAAQTLRFNAVVTTAQIVAATATVTDAHIIRVESTGTVAANFGGGLRFDLETATADTVQSAGRVVAAWTDATNATRRAKLQLSAYDTAQRIGLEIEATGTVVKNTFFGGVLFPYVAKTADYTLTVGDYTVNCTANSFNITLPTAVGFAGQVYNIKNTGTGVITILTTSSQTVDGAASGSITLDQYDNLTVQSDGANWIIL